MLISHKGVLTPENLVSTAECADEIAFECYWGTHEEEYAERYGACANELHRLAREAGL